MNVRSAIARASAMDAQEIRFRVGGAARRQAGRVRFAVSRPDWTRSVFASLVDPACAPLVTAAHDAAARGGFLDAHRAFAEHLLARESRWPLTAPFRERLSGQIHSRFPDAARTARARADRVLQGRLDLLGFRDVPVGNPPRWHDDPVHRRQALDAYWADVPYLDPAYGDHKVIWEINRHQHFLWLGAAFWLTGGAVYRETFVAHLESWLASNPPLRGVNWASMLELAFRSMSWTWAAEFFAAGAADDESPWLIDLLVALDRQLTHIEQNLSRYFSPNTHLSGEALALYAVSLAFPELTHSAHRAAAGRDVLLREAERQIRPDGGHAELSPHYHRYSTDFYLLALMVARAAGDPAADAFERAAHRQAAYMRTIADDQGRLPLIGDDDGGHLFRFDATPPWDASATLSIAASLLSDPSLAVRASTPSVFWALGREPEDAGLTPAVAVWPSHVLEDSGYFVSRSAGGGHLVFDAGPHGYLNGGHAHADALSVVLTVANLPLLVDPGTGTYTMDRAVRDRFRSPRMHNTVLIDGVEPSVPGGPFHWRTRSNAGFLNARTGRTFDFAVGALAQPPHLRHARAVLSLHGTGWLIVDRVFGNRETEYEAWWHIHPSWTVAPHSTSIGLEHSSGLSVALACTADDVLVTDDPDAAGFSPEYGRIEIGTALRVRRAASAPFAVATFIPSAMLSTGRLSIAEMKADTPSQPGWVTTAFAVHVNRSDLRIEIAFPDQLEARLPANWPQPCIHLRRATGAEETLVCAE